MGNASFKTLHDFERNQANLKCTCGKCGHRGVVDTQRVFRWYFLHRYPTALEVLHLHLRCHKCRGRPTSWQPTWEKPTFPRWMATEDDWKQLVRRLRN